MKLIHGWDEMAPIAQKLLCCFSKGFCLPKTAEFQKTFQTNIHLEQIASHCKQQLYQSYQKPCSPCPSMKALIELITANAVCTKRIVVRLLTFFKSPTGGVVGLFRRLPYRHECK